MVRINISTNVKYCVRSQLKGTGHVCWLLKMIVSIKNGNEQWRLLIVWDILRNGTTEKTRYFWERVYFKSEALKSEVWTHTHFCYNSVFLSIFFANFYDQYWDLIFTALCFLLLCICWNTSEETGLWQLPNVSSSRFRIAPHVGTSNSS